MKVLDYDGTEHLINKLIDTINSGGSADYIVEEGTSGIWTYRKWASGVMEAYGRESRSTAMTNKIQEYSYYGNQSFTISALGFTDIKSIQVTGQASGHYFGTKVEAFSTSTIQASSRASGSVTSTIDFMIDIKGLWKEFTPSVSSFDASTKTYTPTFASGIAVRSWGKCFVAKIGKIHILSFWGLYSSSAITSDTLILTLESGKKFAGTAGSFSSGSDGAYLRMEANSNTIVASDILANTSYFGQAVFVEL